MCSNTKKYTLKYSYILTTVPEVLCPRPVSDNGTITVSWSYVHTGGLPLTGVSVQYRYIEGSSTNTESVTELNENANMTRVNGLIAGEDYTFIVNATNENGSSLAECPAVNHLVGE